MQAVNPLTIWHVTGLKIFLERKHLFFSYLFLSPLFARGIVSTETKDCVSLYLISWELLRHLDPKRARTRSGSFPCVQFGATSVTWSRIVGGEFGTRDSCFWVQLIIRWRDNPTATARARWSFVHDGPHQFITTMLLTWSTRSTPPPRRLPLSPYVIINHDIVTDHLANHHRHHSSVTMHLTWLMPHPEYNWL